MRVKDINYRDDLTFVSDSQDVDAVRDSVGIDCTDCDSFFVRAVDGEYVEVYGICGIVALLSKQLHDHSPQQ